VKKAIAITLYDKFEELAILVDIIRHNFSGNYLIAVCSNHPEAKDKIAPLDVDGFTPGRDIFFDPELPWERGRPLIVCRSTDSVQRSCSTAIDLGASIVAHMHCDAWPLDEAQLDNHFALVANEKYKFAARGYGFGAYGADVPVGRIDDHFFFFDAPYLQEIGFFDFDPLNMLPHKLSIHGILAMRILTLIGLGSFCLYDAQFGCECWPGREKRLPWYPVKPSSYDPERHFFHVHRQSFPRDWGQQLQALYLRKNGIVKGKYVGQFLDRYHMEEAKLVQQLNALEQELIKSLRKWGIRPEPLAQDFAMMQKALKEAQARPWILTFARNLLRNMWIEFKRRQSGQKARFGYSDSIWPEDVKEYYRGIINKEHFPDCTEFWFDK
jgi:hypothetical protein